VLEPFQRLVEQRQLLAYPYDGFWMAMDTAKDKKRIDELHETGASPWMVWDPKVRQRLAAAAPVVRRWYR
jgi:glucose-1-phosphate cytidylyltransferase